MFEWFAQNLKHLRFCISAYLNPVEQASGWSEELMIYFSYEDANVTPRVDSDLEAFSRNQDRW